MSDLPGRTARAGNSDDRRALERRRSQVQRALYSATASTGDSRALALELADIERELATPAAPGAPATPPGDRPKGAAPGRGAPASEGDAESRSAADGGAEPRPEADGGADSLPEAGERGWAARPRIPVAVAVAGLVVVLIAVVAGYGLRGAVDADRGAAGVRATAGVEASSATTEPFDRRALAAREALAEFTRDQLAVDAPPPGVSDEHFQADTFRLLLTGSVADWTGRVYAAKDVEGQICVVLVQPDTSYAASCADEEDFAHGGVQVTTDVEIVIESGSNGEVSTITGVTATWPANGMTGLRFSSADDEY